MDLQTLSQIAEIGGFIAVVVAIIFGLIQIRDTQRQRHDLASIELVRSFQDSEFTAAFRIIHSLPENMTASEFIARGSESIDAALLIGIKYETMGLLVFRGVVPMDAVQELIGGVAITLWKRLRPWVLSVREEQSSEMFLEWYQWLVERLEERGPNKTEPAFIKHQHWGIKK